LVDELVVSRPPHRPQRFGVEDGRQVTLEEVVCGGDSTGHLPVAQRRLTTATSPTISASTVERNQPPWCAAATVQARHVRVSVALSACCR